MSIYRISNVLPQALCGLLVALLLAPMTLAQEAPDAAPEETDEPAATQRAEIFVADSLPYVPTANTIATKLPTELAWTPANVGVVGATLIEEQNATVLSDALAGVSGVNVQTGNGVFDYFIVRGFDSISSSQVLIDGAPELESSFFQLYNAEQVEVLKGPGGFLYGPNPLAGAVNIVRKQPVLEPVTFGHVGVSYGSFATRRATLDVGTASADGDIAFRVGGLWGDTDGYRQRRDGEAWAINPSLSWRLSEATRFNVNLEVAGADNLPDAGIPVVDGRAATVDRKLAYSSQDDFSTQDILRFQADFETRLSPRVTLRDKLYYRQLDWNTDGTLLNRILPTGFGSLVARTQVQLADEQSLLGNQLEAVITTTTGGVEHQLLAGLEATRMTDEFAIDFALLDPVFLADATPLPLGPQPTFPLQRGDAESTVIAPYLIDQMTFSERLQLLAGVRWDSIDFTDEVSGTDRSTSEVSPMLGLVVAPAEGWSLYANLASSFAPPSPRVVGEQEPERSRQAELGLRRELWGGRLRATLAGFQIERDNIPIPDNNGFTQQAGDQRSRGVEVELVAEASGGLTVVASYAYTDSVLTSFAESTQVGPGPGDVVVIDYSGNRSPFAPEHLANLWLSQGLPRGFSLAGGVRYIGDQVIAADNVTRVDSYLLVDASVTWRRRDVRLSLHLHNITDETYDTRGFGSFSVIPGDPFNATLRVEYRF